MPWAVSDALGLRKGVVKVQRRGKKVPAGVFIWEGFTSRGFLREITTFVEKAGRALGLNDQALFRVQMAVGEAGANSWEHSYRRKKGKLRLEMERRGGEVEVRVIDWGIPFHPEDVPIPRIAKDLDQINLNGLGMLVMRKAMDEVAFSTHPHKGNIVTMRKRLGAKKKATSRQSV